MKIPQGDLPVNTVCDQASSSRDQLATGAVRAVSTSCRRIVEADQCCNEDEILAFVEGRLTSRDVGRVDRHLGSCGFCSALAIEALAACRGFVASDVVDVRCWALEPGICIANRYVVLSMLGQGGMGDVYEAFDLDSRQALALKTGRARSCDRPMATRRLAREATLARRVRHPNVCEVYDDGVLTVSCARRVYHGFMTMELVQGETLARHLRSGRLRYGEAISIARELLLGVAAIHRAGVVHRDIKSHNVMLRTKRLAARCCIVDFGLAIDANQASPLHSDARTSTFEGSPAYMAPEQFCNRATPATDVFGCGAVLFEALTGTLAFSSFRNGGVGAQRDPTETPPRVRQLASDVPQPLDDFVARCLALDPAARFVNAAAALSAIEPLLY